MLNNSSSSSLTSPSPSANDPSSTEVETQIEYELRTENVATLQAMEVQMKRIATSEAEMLLSVASIVASSLDVDPGSLVILSASSPKQLPVSIVFRPIVVAINTTAPSPSSLSGSLLLPGSGGSGFSSPSPQPGSTMQTGINVSAKESNSLQTPSEDDAPEMDMATIIATVATGSVLFSAVVVATVCYKHRLKKRKSKVAPASGNPTSAQPHRVDDAPTSDGVDAVAVPSNLSKKLVLLKRIRDAKLSLLDVSDPEKKAELEATIQDNMQRLQQLDADENIRAAAGNGSATSMLTPVAAGGLRRPGQASMASFRTRNGENGGRGPPPLIGGLHRPGKRSLASFAVRSYVNDEARLQRAIEEGAAAQHNRVMQRLRNRRQSAAAVGHKGRPPPPLIGGFSGGGGGGGGASKLTHRGKANTLTNKHTAVDISKPLDFSSILKRGRTIRANTALFKTEADLDLDGDGVIDDNEREIAAVAKASQESDEKFAQKLESERQDSINRLKNRLQRRRRSSVAKAEERRRASGVMTGGEAAGGGAATGLGISADELAALQAGAGTGTAAGGSAAPAGNFTFE
jgi:hypothetical protein